MGKMEEALRSEMTRLARKEIRATCLPVARDVRELKRKVSELSRTVGSLVKLVEELSRKQRAEMAKLEAPPDEVEKARLSPRLIRTLRKRLGITQGSLAKLVGVSAASVTFWERGHTHPTESNKAALVALRKLGRREVRRLLEPAGK